MMGTRKVNQDWEKLEEVTSWLSNLAFGMFHKHCPEKERRECPERVVAGKRHLSDIKAYPSGGLHSETNSTHKCKFQTPPR